MINVEDVLSVDHDVRDFRSESPDGASYQVGNSKIQNKTFWTSLQSDIKSYLVANLSIEIWKCPDLKLYSRVGESREDFATRCRAAADQAADLKISKLRGQFEKRIDRLQDQISSADSRVKELEADASTRTQTEVMSGIGDLIGAFLKGRFSSTTLSKATTRRGASQKAKTRLRVQEQKLSAKQQDLVVLERDLEDALISIQEEHDAMADTTETLEIGLEKTDIRVAEAKLVWVPVA
jgi:porphobilinogen deaminase